MPMQQTSTTHPGEDDRRRVKMKNRQVGKSASRAVPVTTGELLEESGAFFQSKS